MSHTHPPTHPPTRTRKHAHPYPYLLGVGVVEDLGRGRDVTERRVLERRLHRLGRLLVLLLVRMVDLVVPIARELGVAVRVFTLELLGKVDDE